MSPSLDMEYSWFLIAIIGVAIGSFVYLVDIFLREDEVFVSPIEPTIVSGLFQAMIWVVVPFVEFEKSVSVGIASLAVLGGVLHLASLFFYFKSVFSFGDVSEISMLWNLLVAAVPILALIFLDERLRTTEYTGIMLLLLGATVLSSGASLDRGSFLRVFRYMIVAVILMAFSMVCLKSVYEHVAYWEGYLLYNFGIVGGAVLGYIFFLPRKLTRRFHATFQRFFFLFLGIELLQLLAEFFSNVAINLGPVSLVSAVESIQPVFVILLSLGILVAGKCFFPQKAALLQSLCLPQLSNFRVKVLALLCMLAGVYLVNS